MMRKPWPTWAKVAVSCSFLVVCVVLPVTGYVLTEIAERRSPGTPTPEATDTALFYGIVLAITNVVTAPSLMWTLWGRAPGIIRYYTWSWAAIFVCIAGTMALLYGMVASSEPDPMTAFAVMALVPPTFGMLAGTVLGVVPAVIARIVLGDRFVS